MHLTHFPIILLTTSTILSTTFAAAISTPVPSTTLLPSKTIHARSPNVPSTTSTQPPPTPSVLDTDTLTAFLNLIASISSSDLTSSDGTSEFFTKIRNCLSGTLQGIFISNLPLLVSASSQFASITSAVPAAITSAVDVVESKASELASIATEIPVKAASLAEVVESKVTAVIPQITSAVAEIPKVIVPAATSVLGNVGDDIGDFFGGLFGKRQLSNTVTCFGLATKTTVVFKVGNCVGGIAEAGASEEIVKIRGLVDEVGGVGFAMSNVDVLNEVAKLGQQAEGCRGMVSGGS
jgi:hypothetical protein